MRSMPIPPSPNGSRRPGRGDRVRQAAARRDLASGRVRGVTRALAVVAAAATGIIALVVSREIPGVSATAGTVSNGSSTSGGSSTSTGSSSQQQSTSSGAASSSSDSTSDTTATTTPQATTRTPTVVSGGTSR